jgi:sugar phosphate isomerase/epimerase
MIKVGLYSISYLGAWYRGPALDIPQLIDRASRFGFDGLELDGKRPHASPLDLTCSRCADIRKMADDAGIELYAVAANNDLSSPVPEQRESQLLNVRQLIQLTASLGAPVLRVFAAWPGITLDTEGASYEVAERISAFSHSQIPGERTWELCREGLAECAQWAGDAGITLALQNHSPITDSGEMALKLIREVNSPALKAAFDAPLARKQNVRNMRTACHAFKSLQVLTHFGGEYTRSEDGSIHAIVRRRDGTVFPEDFYTEFTAGMLDIGYDGYTGYELCHPLPKIDGQPAGLEFVDQNVKLAVEYMRAVINTVAREHENRVMAG